MTPRDHFCTALQASAHQFMMRHFVQVALESEELLHLQLEVMRRCHELLRGAGALSY